MKEKCMKVNKMKNTLKLKKYENVFHLFKDTED